MPLIPAETIVAVREATDIVALVGRYVRDLKAAGKNYKARCPFHDEKTPSFTVNPEKQTYHCFGCSEGGNAISFLMKIEGLPFPDAIKQLANEHGIVIPENADPEFSKREEYYKLNNWVSEWYSYSLKSKGGESAREYLKGRKISEEMIDAFELGFAPEGWQNLVEASQGKELPQDLLQELSLVVKKETRSYDFFRNRLMFPIHDGRSRVVGFGGRALDDSDMKYTNSRESDIFIKSQNLYGIHLASRALRRDKQAVLVEGYTDVIMAHQFGFDATVAALGTAFTKDHARVLKRYVDRVILALDADEAGQKAALRALPILIANGIEVKMTLLPDGQDPCDFLLKQGAEAFGEKLESALDMVDFYFAQHKNPGPDQIHQTLKTLGALISTMPSPILRELYQNKASELSGLKNDSLDNIMREEIAENTPKTGTFQPLAKNPELEEADRVPEAEMGVLASLIFLPKKATIIIESLGPVELTHPLIIRMISKLYEHISGSPDTTPALCSAIFQEESEMALVVKCEEMAPSSHWKHFLDCLRILKQQKLELYDRLAQEAHRAGDAEARKEYMRKRYLLTKDLKGVTVQE
jgi:DNA primase